MKKAINIVLSKSLANDERKACIFYSDGSVENLSYKDTIAILTDMEKNKNDFRESKVFVMTEEELNRRYDDFIVEVPKPKTIEEAIEAAFNSLSEDSFLEIKQEDSYYVTVSDSIESDNKTLATSKFEEITPVVEEENVKEINDFADLEEFNEELNNTEEISVDTITEKEINEEKEDITKIFTIKNPLTNEEITNKKTIVKDLELTKEEKALFDESNNEDIDEFINENLPDEEEPMLEEYKVKEGKVYSLLKRFDPFHKANHRAGALVGIGIMGLSLISCSKPAPTPTQDLDFSNAVFSPAEEIDDTIDNETNKSENAEENVSGNEAAPAKAEKHDSNIYYNNYTFDQLLEVTTNPAQKKAMQNIGEALDWYNGEFADAFVEEDKDIRTALTWDEMVALQIAYNDYSKEDLHAIFNGAEIDSDTLTNAYKNASLQLICAFILEDEDHLLDVSKFIHDEEGIAFVQKYQNMLERAKNATGDEKIAAVEALYSEALKDFPITEEVRTEGISHADTRNFEGKHLFASLIIDAGQMMFQNLEIDKTLDDKTTEYFDTLGLCNLAEEKFEKIETIVLSCCKEDETNPTYEQFKNAKIKELKEKNIYVIDDEHRDLSQLDRFQELVNWHFKMSPEGFYETEVWYETNTYTVVKKWKVKTTKKKHKKEVIKTDDRDKAVKEVGEEKVKEAEEEVDKQIEEENEKNKEIGEKEGQEKQEEMQEEEDKKKEELEEEVKKDEEDLQKDIEDANKQIEENNKDEDKTNDDPVNESDFGDHNVDFDDEHSDDNGDLDDSVKDITTDGTDSHDYSDLPDPNQTGKVFDEAFEEDNEVVNESSHEESTPAPKEESAPAPKEEAAPAPKQESAPAPKEEPAAAPAPKAESSNEKAVNDYVEKQASEPQQDEEEKVLVKE